ncbi:hypothetical protein N7470_001058 [Penicillium chermesinum]|nr:hypothetical protein N7470_001058 [Penicillium chermesinum]
MSAHVVVIDSTARRATIKTTPSKHLTDILHEACTKFGYNPTPIWPKQLDLSLSFRLSGLSSGAKLELVQLSRSPSVVTVALQLPESEARGAPNGRLLDKFPSTTTLWLVLRKFEAGVAGGGPVRNLTARGVPATTGDSGSGRVVYEIPVLQILERELSSFTDLQKSLAQLGFNSGNVLIRLSFRQTEEPMEEAMEKIGEYFKSVGEDMLLPAPVQASSATPAATAEEPASNTQDSQPTEPTKEPAAPASDQDTAPASASPDQLTLDGGRSITVFSPPVESIPSSAQIPYNEEDYIPSVEHAKAHQRQLNQSSRPQRLPTDAEIAAKAAAEEKRRSQIREVDVKIRFPDQSQIVAKFGPADTGQALYDFVRQCVTPEVAGERFALNVFGSSGSARPGNANIIPDSDKTLLIKDLGLAGRVLVNFTWADPKRERSDILRPELRRQARALKVEQPPDLPAEPLPSVAEQTGPSDSGDGKKPGGLRKNGGVPKWLKLPGKK